MNLKSRNMRIRWISIPVWSDFLRKEQQRQWFISILTQEIPKTTFNA